MSNDFFEADWFLNDPGPFIKREIPLTREDLVAIYDMRLNELNSIANNFKEILKKRTALENIGLFPDSSSILSVREMLEYVETEMENILALIKLANHD